MIKKVLLILLPLLIWAVPNPPNRRSNAPYVHGDAFRAISDYAYDELSRFLDPYSIKPGSAIFVKGDYVEAFFNKIHPHIPCKYVLIVHNSDEPTPGECARFLDDEKLVAWFGQNFDGQVHPKMIPIPIGIANYQWVHGKSQSLKQVQLRRLPKNDLIHMNFESGNYPLERKPIFEKYSQTPYCHTTSAKPFMEYLIDVASAKFEFAPRGNGLDTHRLWESLYLGTIPIVKTSSLDSLYSGLPVLIVQSWDEVDEEFLNQKYCEFTQTIFNLEKMSMEYWERLIDSYKNLCH